MEKLQIVLLGQFSVRSERGPIKLQTSLASLMGYLALFDGRPLGRARVAGTLWPDLPEERARANLSTVTWRLREAISAEGYSAEIIRASTESLGLDLDACDIDVLAFRRQSLGPGSHAISLEALARAAHALELYRGDLLEDWDVEWCQLEREELRQRYHHTLRGLAEGFERRGRYDLALQYVQRAVSTEPLNESAHRLLMRILYRTGDRTSAINHFKRFADLARSELGVEPDKETLELLSEIRGLLPAAAPASAIEGGASVTIHPEVVPLLGRDDQRQQAARLMDAALSGTGGAMLVIGDAGIGKSRLVNWIVEEWASRGGAIAQGRCIEFNEPVPYQPLLDALGSYLDAKDLSGFVRQAGGPPYIPVLDDGAGQNISGEQGPPSSKPAGKLRLFNWLTAVLGDVIQRHPLLLVVEDLQWADEGTVDFLAHLLDRARSMNLAVFLTSRPADSRPNHAINVERLCRYCGDVVRLDPLSAVETTQLIRFLLSEKEVSRELASWVYAETEGNPLFVIETLRLLMQKGNLRAPDQDSTADAGSFSSRLSMPEGVRSVVQQRLRLLDPASLRIAEIASVLGRSFEEELLGMISSTSENRLSRAIGHLLRAGIFERENAGYRFTHDKIRALCYESLSARARRTYHARAAATLAQVPDVPVHRLAWHQLCAGQWHLAAISWAQAGDEARQVHAYVEAVRAYRHAVSSVRRDEAKDNEGKSAEEVRLLVKLDEVLAILGRPADRREILDRMGIVCRRTPGASLQAIWLIRRALLEEHIGNFRSAASLARAAWSLARATSDHSVEAEALRVLAWALSRSGRHQRSLSISRLLLRKLGDADSPTKATALWQAAATCIVSSDYTSGASYLRLAKGTLSRVGYSGDYPLILIGEAIVHRMTGHPQASRVSLLKALRQANDAADRITSARASIHLATLDALEGKLGDALRGLRRASTGSRSAGYTRTYIACLNEVAYSVGRLIGDYQWAWNATDLALSLFEPSESRDMLTMLKSSQAQLLLDQDRFDQATAVATEVLRQFKCERSSCALHRHYQESLAIRGASLLSGNLPQALTDLQAARDIHVRTNERLLLVDTLAYLALAHAKSGDADRALATSEEALRVLADIGYANFQPQRIFWHHYQILEMFDRSPRLPYLERAVEFVDAQASSLSRAQARRLRQEVRLNRDILAAWERHRQPLRQVHETVPS